MIRKNIFLWGAALREIRLRLMHTLLSVLGIIIGVAALVCILSFIDGMEKYAREQISSTTDFEMLTLRISRVKMVDGVPVRRDSLASFSPQDFESLERKRSITARSSFLLRQNREVQYLNQEKKSGALCLAVNSLDASPNTLVAGRNFTNAEVKNKAKLAVLDSRMAEKFLGNKNYQELLQTYVQVGKDSLEIIGVIEEQIPRAGRVFFPISLIEVDREEIWQNTIVIWFLDNVEKVLPLKQEVQAWLDENYPQKTDHFFLESNDARLKQIQKAFLLFRVIMGLIVGISVLVGGIGVMNVLLISVNERTREIGVRMAVGAKRRDIIRQFLYEAIAVSTLGCMLGLVLGTLASWGVGPLIQLFLEVPFRATFTLQTLLLISVLALLIGIIFGTYPAIRASRLDPVEAIRRE